MLTMTIYDRISSIYDWLIISERPYRDRALELLDVQPGETVLDIGCSTGLGTLFLAQNCKSVCGIDISEIDIRHVAQ